MTRPAPLLLTFSLLPLLGCTPPRAPSEEPSPEISEELGPENTHDPSSQESPRTSSDHEPASDEPRLVSLEVPGFLPALIVLPRAQTSDRPPLFAVHGAGDGPRHQCALWNEILRGSRFIVCPAGTPLGKEPEAGYFFRDHHALEAEVLATIEAFRARYGERVSSPHFVYAAYSQGATMGALFLRKQGALFPWLILMEGGSGEWNVALGRQYRASGGERVLFACGTPACAERARRSQAWLVQADLDARQEYAEGAGHIYWGAVAERVVQNLPWLFGDELRPPQQD